MKCKLCDKKVTVRNFAMHLRWNHPKYKTQDYIKEFGEFRPKQLKERKIKEKSKVKCEECNIKLKSNQQLMHHIKKHHPKITQEQYIITHKFNGEHPTCICGCGKKTTFIRHGKNSKGEECWFNPYIKGHWDWIQPGYNTHSEITKDLMSELAKIRVKNQTKKQGFANIHSPQVLEKRRKKRKDKALNKFFNSHPTINLRNLKEIETLNSCLEFQYQCKVCNYEWEQKTLTPRCIKCNPYEFNNISKEEKQLVNFIIKHYPKSKLKLNNRTLIPPYEVDIFIPQHNLALEYNGLYWHSEIFKQDNNYHYKKFNLAKDNNIKLIQIFSDEWVNKRDIVESRILNLLKLTPNKIYARNCEINEITPQEKNQFLNKNHIQGEDRSKVKLGLFHNGELVSVMTFGSPRKAIGMKKEKVDNQYELIRFCNKLNFNVVGGASKLFKFFLKNYNPSHIYSFADNRWSSQNNNLYTTLGFELTKQSNPGYWYTKDFTSRIHRFNFNKTKLKKLGFDTENLTEHNIMNSLKYYKIWDCGVSRYEYKI